MRTTRQSTISKGGRPTTTHHYAEDTVRCRRQPISRPSILGGEQLWRYGIQDTIHHLQEKI